MKKYIFLFLCFINTYSFSQVNRNGTLTTIIDSLIDAMPSAVDNNDYQTPSGANLTSWGNVIQDILDGDYSGANTTANTFGYTLYNLTDTSQTPDKTYYLLSKNTGSTNHWGTFVYDPAAERQKLFIQCPHPIFDTNTGYQGIRIFKNVGARAYIVSGTHRCNNTTETTCAGTSTVCGGTKYRISDLAHNIDGTFQKSTEIFEAAVSGLIVIQPHGFSKDGEDPDLIMSNGNTNTPSSTDYLSNLKTNLLNEDGDLTFKIAHIDTGWTELLATTNTQGRLINGSGNPCNQSASTNAGRFLHIEQAYDSLRDSETNWNKLSDAVEATFASDPLPVALTFFTANIYKNEFVELHWNTATEVNNYGFEIQRQRSLNNTNWEKIGFVNGHGNSNSPKYYSFIDKNINPGKYFYRLKQIDFDGAYEYSEIVSISVNVLQQKFLLEQNYPNPFNPVTKIKFTIPYEGVENAAYLKIYDVLGNEVVTIIDGLKLVGYNEVEFNGENFASGIYYYNLTAGKFSETKKMILMK